MAQPFSLRWQTDRNEMENRKFSLWDMSGFRGTFWFLLILAAVLGLIVTGLIVLDNHKKISDRNADVRAYEAIFEKTKMFNETWHALRDDRCTLDLSVCARLKMARSYAMIPNFDPSADTKEAAHFREILKDVPPLFDAGKELSLDRIVRVILKKDDMAFTEYPEDPRVAGPVEQNVLWFWLYVGIAYGGICIVLSIWMLVDEETYWRSGAERRFRGFYHPLNHTIGSWFAALFVWSVLIPWVYALCDDAIAWVRWYVPHARDRHREAREIERKAEVERLAREQATALQQREREKAIERLDDDLRANYYAIMEAQRVVRELVAQAPDEDSDAKQSLLSNLQQLEQDVLRVHEMQTERDRVKRRQRLADIAAQVQGIVADVRGRMELSKQITEDTRDTIA